MGWGGVGVGWGGMGWGRVWASLQWAERRLRLLLPPRRLSDSGADSLQRRPQAAALSLRMNGMDVRVKSGVRAGGERMCVRCVRV